MNALISKCNQYRYWLSRPAEDLYIHNNPAFFVMLNPSTADEITDDATIRRCRGFARGWGCNGLVVANLYAFRSKKPIGLKTCDDPIGPENDYWLEKMIAEHVDVVCAWGAKAGSKRIKEFMDIAEKAGARLWCLGVTKEGHPRHPLYVKAEQPRIKWASKQGVSNED